MEPEREGRTLKDVDLSKVERQFLHIKNAADAVNADLAALASAFEKAGIWQSDPAREFAAEMLNKPYDQVTPEERAKAKSHPLFYLKMYSGKPPN